MRWSDAQTRFMGRFVKADNGCWIWNAPGPLRYGRIFIAGRGSILAHRFAYELFRGQVPTEQMVLHSCDNQRCVNPDHLRLGSHADNMRDMVDRKRARKARVTHCPQGHEYNEANIKWYQGRRYCVQCHAARKDQRYAASRRRYYALKEAAGL